MKELLLRLLDKIKLRLGFKSRYLKMLDKRVVMIIIEPSTNVPAGREDDSVIGMHEYRKHIERDYAIGATQKFGKTVVIPIKAIDHGTCIDLIARYRIGR